MVFATLANFWKEQLFIHVLPIKYMVYGAHLGHCQICLSEMLGR